MTDKTTAALKLAEEALEELHYSSGTVKAVTLYKSALSAIREALADHVAASGKVIAEQEKQEPVAWHEPNAYGNVTTHKKWAEENGWLPLYTKE